MTATAIGVQPAIAIHPGQANSLHLTEIPRDEPGLGEVLIRVRQVGICGTDRELIHGSFGTAPSGAASLVLGHEMLGRVEAVGPEVFDFVPGQLVTVTVRRPDGCPACTAGQPDMCQRLDFTERGIAGSHGFMTESIVEDVHWVVGVPHELAHIGILVEPLSVVEKAFRQANLIQRRLSSWNPKTALVLGAGPIGLLGTLLVRSRGMEVVTMARRTQPRRSSWPPALATPRCKRRASRRSRLHYPRSTSSSRLLGMQHRDSPRCRSSATTACWSSSPVLRARPS